MKFIFSMSQTLRFEYVNRCAQRNLGHSMDVLRMMTPLDIKPEFDEASFRTMADPLLHGEKEILIFETIHLRADGTLYPVEVHLQLFEQSGRAGVSGNDSRHHCSPPCRGSITGERSPVSDSWPIPFRSLHG